MTPPPTDLDALCTIRRRYREAGKTVVWTNGCFDILHAGHVHSLQAAADLGDILIVGLNDDDSVRSLKGADRPLIPARHRAAMLLGLSAVDHVLVFSGTRCTEVLERLQPDIYAQGEDYTLETIDQDERAAVEAGGGRIAFLPFLEGFSTSLLLKKVRRADPGKIITAAFGMIRNDAGRLLLVANRYLEGIRWGLPGGGHERGESLEETVLRECREEIGINGTVTGYKGVIERIEPKLNLHLVLHLFEIDPGTDSPILGNEDEDIVDLGWFDIPRLKAHDGWILGRAHWIRYLENPSEFGGYIFMGPGEE